MNSVDSLPCVGGVEITPFEYREIQVAYAQNSWLTLPDASFLPVFLGKSTL